ncbi:SAM domain-containing protein [Ensifer canadensis]
MNRRNAQVELRFCFNWVDPAMNDVTAWMAEIGLGHLTDKFVDAQIDFDTLALLSDQDLRELGIPMGPRRKLLAAIAAFGSSVRRPGGRSDSGRTPPINDPGGRHGRFDRVCLQARP